MEDIPWKPASEVFSVCSYHCTRIFFLYSIYDFGGQLSKHEKWIHYFEGVRAIIFVAAMSEYDLTLEEDQGMVGVICL